ncbi:hypothetical protein DVH05_006450 [Phytophthora capsici]|nr:hypothetical protein DVH05_006450 [Phytophthora capsici]
MPNLDGDSSHNGSSDEKSLDMELDNGLAVSDILQQESVKRLIRQAMLTKKFPPQTLCAECDRSCGLAASLFGFPVFIWVLECLNADQNLATPILGAPVYVGSKSTDNACVKTLIFAADYLREISVYGN